MLLGIDTGGTFTDFVLYDGSNIIIHKVLSTPEAPERAILQGITELNLNAAIAVGGVSIIHGSTVATNAALEHKGVRTAFVTNKGFRDLLSIGRQTRSELYNLQPAPQAVPVPSELCLEVDCRVDARGRIITPLSQASVDALCAQLQQLQPQAVAINLLFSYLNSEHERQIEAALPDHYFVSRSSFVLPEYKEYERGIATWLNAYLGPLVNRYLNNLQQSVRPSPLAIMQSSGGTIDATQASQRAVNLLLSGPAGGLAAAKFVGEQAGVYGLMTFDMGGTSTDVALVEDELRITNEGRLGRYPVAVPMIDMHTIGAGGGSIAFLDDGGLLQVGPQSAGASPGPACYSRGGTQATVTDANVVLGRIRPDAKLAGHLPLDVAAAQQAVAALAVPLRLSVEEMAQGIVQLANEHMARALRVISVQRGRDPRQFHLCCFGGAGGLHVCDLAESLNMTKALVPQFGGVLSALGMLVAPRERQLSHTVQQPLAQTVTADITEQLQRLSRQGLLELRQEGVAENEISYQPRLDLRYLGQSYCININIDPSIVDWLSIAAEQFHQQHEWLYGHRMTTRPIELVTVRQRTFSKAPTIALPLKKNTPVIGCGTLVDLYGIGPTLLIAREDLSPKQQLSGPLLIVESVATTLIKPGWQVTVDDYGNLLLHRY